MARDNQKNLIQKYKYPLLSFGAVFGLIGAAFIFPAVSSFFLIASIIPMFNSWLHLNTIINEDKVAAENDFVDFCKTAQEQLDTDFNTLCGSYHDQKIGLETWKEKYTQLYQDFFRKFKEKVSNISFYTKISNILTFSFLISNYESSEVYTADPQSQTLQQLSSSAKMLSDIGNIDSLSHIKGEDVDTYVETVKQCQEKKQALIAKRKSTIFDYVRLPSEAERQAEKELDEQQATARNKLHFKL